MPGVLSRFTGLLAKPHYEYHHARRHAAAYRLLAAISLIARAFQSSLVFISLFQPPVPYRIADPGNEALGSDDFLRVLSATTGG